jgi:hypothetical protein
VMMAMQSAFTAADTVEVCLNQPQNMHQALNKFDRTMRVGPKVFSWFIYRVTNPVIRNMFMEPRNVFRVKEAVLSVLAGDVYGKTPIHLPLILFKTIYYLGSLFTLKRTINAWKMRKKNIKTIDEVGSAVS